MCHDPAVQPAAQADSVDRRCLVAVADLAHAFVRQLVEAIHGSLDGGFFSADLEVPVRSLLEPLLLQVEGVVRGGDGAGEVPDDRRVAPGAAEEAHLLEGHGVEVVQAGFENGDDRPEVVGEDELAVPQGVVEEEPAEPVHAEPDRRFVGGDHVEVTAQLLDVAPTGLPEALLQLFVGHVLEVVGR